MSNRELCYNGEKVKGMVKGKQVVVHDLMQQGYTYTLSEATGQNFHPEV